MQVSFVVALGFALGSCTGAQPVTPTSAVTIGPTTTVSPTTTAETPVSPTTTTEAPSEAGSPIEWTPTAGFPVDGVFWAIAVEPGDPRRLYAAVENLGFLHSRDGGLTWERNDVGHHFPRGILLDPVDDDNLYYGYGSGLEVYERDTGGHQWSVELDKSDRPSASLDPPSYSLANRVTAVVADATGGTIFLSSPAGVFRTTDHGRNFETIGGGLPGPTIYSALATHPADPDVIYVGTRGPWYYDSLFPGHVPEGYEPRGLFRSVDGGESWAQLGGPLLATLEINAVLLDESRPSRVWIGTSDGVYLSEDDGATWAETSSGLLDARVWTLVQDPSDSERLFAGTLGGGLFVSTTGGSSWQPSGLNALDFHRDRIFSLTFDPNDAGRLYVGTGQGLFRYHVASGSYEQVPGTVFYSAATDLTIAPDDPSRLYALEGGAWAGRDLYRSGNGGGSWEFLGPLQPLASTRGGAGCVGSLDCPPYSIDHTYGMHVRVNPQDPLEVWYSSGSGLFVSRDGGDHWRLVDTRVLSDQFHFHGIAISPADPRIIYVGTGGSLLGDEFVFTHVLKTVDGGQTWALADDGLPRTNYHMEFLLVDPRDPNVVYMGASDREFGCVSNPQPPCVGVGIYRTTDGGRTWSAANEGLEDLDIYTLALDAGDPDTLYAGAGNALYVSHDRGESWSKTFSFGGEGSSWVTAVASAAEPHRLLVVGTSDDGVYVSTDDGATWSPASEGFGFHGQVPPTGRGLVQIDALVIAPDGTIYAAAGGVFRGTYLPVD